MLPPSLPAPSQVDLSSETMEHLIHLVYRTLEDYSVWEEFLEALRLAIGAKFIHMIAYDKSNGALSYSANANMPPEIELDFIHKYQFIEPRISHVQDKPLLEWVHDHNVVSEETMATHPFYQEYMKPADAKYISMCRLVDNEKALMLFGAVTQYDSVPFDSDCIAFLSRITPHISRVCQLGIQQFTYSTQALVGQALVNKLRQPVILVSTQGEAIHVNESAEQLLKSTQLISIKNGQLLLPLAYSQTFFDDCVQMEYLFRGNETSTNPSPFKLLQINSPDKKQTLYAFYSLLIPQHMKNAFGLRPLVMLFFYHPESAPKIDTTILTAAFGFTPAECRIAILLADGLSQKEIANRQGTKHDTVRKQLHAMYQKTSTKQQSELIRLMLHLPSNFVQEPA